MKDFLDKVDKKKQNDLQPKNKSHYVKITFMHKDIKIHKKKLIDGVKTNII